MSVSDKMWEPIIDASENPKLQLYKSNAAWINIHLRNLNIGMKKVNIWLTFAIGVSLLSSCVPIIHTKKIVNFKNITNDTLVIGASHYNNVDSVKCMLWPRYVDSSMKSKELPLWNNINSSQYVIYPDSICGINADFISYNYDCYFFLIKWKDIKKHSWNEIRTQKMFYCLIVKKKNEYDFLKTVNYR